MISNNYKIGDIVYNKDKNTIGIVRDVFKDRGGDLRTDADGVVPISDLEKYDPENAKHKQADIAPSTQREIDRMQGKGYIVDIDSLGSPTKERVKNGAAEILYDLGNVHAGDIGIINGGYYDGLIGQLLYGIKDGGSYSYTIKVLEGPDEGVQMDYVLRSESPLRDVIKYGSGGIIENIKSFLTKKVTPKDFTI